MPTTREFGGLAIDDLDGIYLEITRGFRIPPKFRGEDYIVASKEGRSAGDRVADLIDSILLEGYVRADPMANEGPEEWLAKRQQLLEVLDAAAKTPAALIVTAPDYGLAAGFVASITARFKNLVEGPIIAYRDQTISVELTSIDPYWIVTPP